MNVTVCFVRVNTKAEYNHGHERWLAAYKKHTAGHPHELAIINRYADNPDNMFDGAIHFKYSGGGWDCGSWKFAGKHIDTDLLVCFNSSTYVTGPGWLKRIVEAVERHGDGLYGPMASYEVCPHIRTPCMAFQPHVINDYPMEVESRPDSYRFESFGFGNGVPNFTQWTRQKGLATMMVTWDGEYDQPQWRTPPNIFRRGDQSNLIVHDRHVEAYAASSPEGKAYLEKLAG